MVEHGGRVKMKSENGRTTLTLQLPVKNEESKS